MLGEGLAELLRRSAAELGREAVILEKAASIVKGAKNSLEELIDVVESGEEVQMVPDLREEDLEDVRVDRYIPTITRCSEANDVLVFDGKEVEVNRSRLERALRDSGLTKRSRMIDKIRSLAQANEGLVSPGQIAPLIIAVGLSTSSARNLPGYMLHVMHRSGEFQRVGAEGTGLYRWLPYEGAARQDGHSLENGMGWMPDEASEYEEVPV